MMTTVVHTWLGLGSTPRSCTLAELAEGSEMGLKVAHRHVNDPQWQADSFSRREHTQVIGL